MAFLLTSCFFPKAFHLLLFEFCFSSCWFQSGKTTITLNSVQLFSSAESFSLDSFFHNKSWCLFTVTRGLFSVSLLNSQRFCFARCRWENWICGADIDEAVKTNLITVQDTLQHEEQLVNPLQWTNYIAVTLPINRVVIESLNRKSIEMSFQPQNNQNQKYWWF